MHPPGQAQVNATGLSRVGPRVSSVWTERGMPALLGTTLAGFTGFAVLMPIAPLWAVHGGADAQGAGLVNGVLLLLTVLTQLSVPSSLRRFGWGPVLAIGVALLGVPALAHILTDALVPTLVLAAVRGVGFGILTVTGSAAIAELSDPARRGAAVGAYGLAIAAPQIVVLPLGPWVADTIGFAPVFALGALPLLGVWPALSLGRTMQQRSRQDEAAAATTATTAEDSQMRDEGDDVVAAGLVPADPATSRVALMLLRPMVILLGVTLAGGGILTFAPQMIDDPPTVVASLAALQAAAATTRWRIGAIADRYGPEPFLWPLVLITVVAMCLAAWAVSTTSLWLFLAASLLLGLPYGALQNLTLLISLRLVTRRHYGLASATWNVGYDLGTGLGSVLVGTVAVSRGFPTALVVTAALALLTLPLATRLRPGKAWNRRAARR